MKQKMKKVKKNQRAKKSEEETEHEMKDVLCRLNDGQCYIFMLLKYEER